MDGIDEVDGDDDAEEDFEWPDDHGVEGDKDVDESSDKEEFDGTIGWEPLTVPPAAFIPDAPDAHEHIYEDYSEKIAGSENIYAPFESKLDFDIALWAKMRGLGSTAFTDLLAIDNVHDRLGLLYKNSRELNNIIDKKLPITRPQFRRQEVVIAGEAFDVYFRDVVECVKVHYADKDKTMWLYHDMHTGKWWWHTQKQVEKEKPGSTIMPIILSSDKTQVTVFGNKTAYPHIKNRASQRRTITNLFHVCMGHILEPLKSAGKDGLHMRSGDGITRCGHPILACYVSDYPEQILVSGTMTGECPKCDAPNSELGSKDAPFKPWDLESILAALDLADKDPIGFAKCCAKLRIKPIQHPFLQGHPKLNIFHAITPDVLHQLYQGLVKHMIAWINLARVSGKLMQKLLPKWKLKDISDRVVPGAYGVKMGDDEKINRLLNLMTFIYKFDGKGNPIFSQPFDHPAINTVCQLAFFTSQDQVGIKYKDRFVSVLDDNDEPEVPNSMVSAVVTMIFSSLLDLKSVVDGGREHGNFGQGLIGMFDNNMEMLNGIYAKDPHVYHCLMA
ncbi:hypothetical protein EDD22DRAFT_851095 [Suillus occidentalis]|nr:hypothetical protein EDD22DRAFT_851095 [Suillus occidentalis]